ncbi:MAG: CotH kinase family protein, partial [Candidatus Cloacimonetes bacterium]|nr:CotH kinase family protein [Candidatus Cloacimonadota bacterium]
IITQSYIFDIQTTLPVISLTTDPFNFFDEEYGMYVVGNNPDNPNYNQDWERPLHVELFEQAGKLGFSIDAGVKIYGAFSRRFAQKSLAIHTRAIYGPGELEYRLFPEMEIDKFESFILRNAGNDWIRTMFADALITNLYKNGEVEKQAYRPASIYLNGEYWGILNIREKNSKHFIASHNQIPANEIELLERDGLVIERNNDHYIRMMDFIVNSNISSQENYQYIKTQMDVANFINYYVIEIFSQNYDWPAKNNKYWRHATEIGRWKWLLYDTELGFGLTQIDAYQHETLLYMMDTTSTHWGNRPWSTLLFRRLLTNDDFVEEFASVFCDHLNSTFKSETVLQQIQEKSDLIAGEIDRHIARWNAIEDWDAAIERLERFAELRPDFMFEHIQDFFDYSNPVELTIEANMAEAGTIHLNTIKISEFPWSGKYFTENSLSVTAVPNYGYRFVGWHGLESTQPTVDFTLNEDTTVTALFEELPIVPFDIVINEINYNSAEDFDTGDWIELYNPNCIDKDISGWEFKDEDDSHVYTFTRGQIIPGRGFLVLCQAEEQFREHFPEADCSIGNFDFGLSGKGELLRLFDYKGVLIDSVKYDDEFPWAVEPDGMGATLSLLRFSMDNSLPQSWSASDSNGSPGVANFPEGNEEPELAINNLYASYPNPFNPKTTIPYQLAQESNVKLSVYNIKGQLVTTLVDQRQKKGFHSVIWTADKVSSGIYFIRLSIGDFTSVRKCLLLK